MAMITGIETYFDQGCGRCARFGTPDCSTRLWAGGLAALRRLCLGAGLSEHVKWGHPCYMHGGRNVAIIGAFRGDFRLSFFHAALLSDPGGVLTRQGPNTRHADAIRFAGAADVARNAATVRDLLAQATAHAEAGRLPPREPAALELPDALAEALAADPEMSAAFDALTPGRQRSHALFVGGAKKAETQAARAEKMRDRIMAGFGATERLP